MPTVWFMIVSVMIAAYVVLDGFDLGAGIIYLGAARTTDERLKGLHSIGPGWDPVFSLPATLRVSVQRLLSSADDRALASDAARHRHRTTLAYGKSGLA